MLGVTNRERQHVTPAGREMAGCHVSSMFFKAAFRKGFVSLPDDQLFLDITGGTT